MFKEWGPLTRNTWQVQLHVINDLVKTEGNTCVRVDSEPGWGPVPLHYPVLDLPIDPCVGVVSLHAEHKSARGLILQDQCIHAVVVAL